MKTKFSTNFYDNVGTYDFSFTIQKIEFADGITNVFVKIDCFASFESICEEDCPTYLITQEFINANEIGWEVDLEIRDIVTEILVIEMPIDKNAIELNIQYPRN